VFSVDIGVACLCMLPEPLTPSLTTLGSTLQVDLRHMDEKTGSNEIEVGVDLSEFYMSVEWDILEVPAVR
jgi:hypothetical protein